MPPPSPTIGKRRAPGTAWRTRHDAELAVFRWVEGWYNPRRLQRALGWRSPAEYERATTPAPI